MRELKPLSQGLDCKDCEYKVDVYGCPVCRLEQLTCCKIRKCRYNQISVPMEVTK